jgi:hypothetical protein
MKAELARIERQRAIMQKTLPQLNVFKYMARKASGLIQNESPQPPPEAFIERNQNYFTTI